MFRSTYKGNRTYISSRLVLILYYTIVLLSYKIFFEFEATLKTVRKLYTYNTIHYGGNIQSFFLYFPDIFKPESLMESTPYYCLALFIVFPVYNINSRPFFLLVSGTNNYNKEMEEK